MQGSTSTLDKQSEVRKQFKDQLAPWMDAQIKILKDKGAHYEIVGIFSYTFTPTGLGIIYVVECEEINLTNFSDW